MAAPSPRVAPRRPFARGVIGTSGLIAPTYRESQAAKGTAIAASARQNEVVA